MNPVCPDNAAALTSRWNLSSRQHFRQSLSIASTSDCLDSVADAYQTAKAIAVTQDIVQNRPKHAIEESRESDLDPIPLAPSSFLKIVAQVSITEGTLMHVADIVLDCLQPLVALRNGSKMEVAPIVERSRPATPSACHGGQENGDGNCLSSTNNSASSLAVIDGPPPSSSSATDCSRQSLILPHLNGNRPITRAEASAFSSSPFPNDESLSSNLHERISSANIRSHQTILWEERFKELCTFRSVHGHCFVPHNWDKSTALAKWVKRQRYQYKLKIEGKHSALTETRQGRLEQLGFVWDSHSAIWEERLRELRDFQSKNGHCNVPSTHQENHSLSIWVQCQRRQYKLFRQGTRCHMNEERIRKLEGIGFVWNPREKKADSTNTEGNII